MRHDQSPASADFVRFAQALLMAKGNVSAAANIADATIRNTQAAYVLKSSVDAGGTADANWAGSLSSYVSMSQGFLESLPQLSVFDAILPAARQVPLATRIGAFTSTESGLTQGQGQPAPVSKFSLAASVLTPRLASGLIVITDELARSMSPYAFRLLTGELKKALAGATNRGFLAELADVANDSSAHASTGGTALEIAHDLGLLAADVITSALCKPFFVMSPANATAAAFKMSAQGEAAFPEMSPTGGAIAGIQVLTSDDLANAGDVLLIDGDALVIDPGWVTLDASDQTSLNMSDSPGDSNDGQMISMFQTNQTALRTLRWHGYELWRDAGVDFTGAAW